MSPQDARLALVIIAAAAAVLLLVIYAVTTIAGNRKFDRTVRELRQRPPRRPSPEHHQEVPDDR